MNEQLKPFVRRIRLVRAWQGFWQGALVAAMIATLIAIGDYFGLIYVEPLHLAAIVGGGALAGAFLNAFRSLPAGSVAASVDRRAGLKDRLASSAQVGAGDAEFAPALQADAENFLRKVRPHDIFPVPFGRPQFGAMGLAAAATAVFLLGNQPWLLSDSEKRNREDSKRQAAKVERVVKEQFDSAKPEEISTAERRLEQDLRKLQRDLERARMNREEALQRQEQIAKKADELMRDSARKVEQNIAQAQTARERLEARAQATQAGDRGSKLETRANELAQKIATANTPAGPKLTASELALAKSKLQVLQKQLAQNPSADAAKSAAEAQRALALSQEAQRIFREIMNSKEWKELSELAAKLNRDAQKAKAGQRSELTEAQRQAMVKKLEELAARLKDPKALKEYLDALREALRQGAGMCRGAGMCFGLGFSPFGGPGPGGAEDMMAFDTKRINKDPKGTPGIGKTKEQFVPGEPAENGGPETFVEIRAPSTVGNRSSVPYLKVLPSYRKKAESALDRKAIPKKYEQRVRDYFGALGP